MKAKYILLLALWLPGLAAAEAMVLLQGYLAYDDPWRSSGASVAMVQAGWQDGGQLIDGPDGVRRFGPEGKAAKSFYTVALAVEAPLLVQAQQMERFMAYVRARHEGESLYLVGHSAGGVVARLYMVQHPKVRIRGLITFASPHLGTGTAEAGRMMGQSPLSWMAPMVGADTLNRSQGLYHDLMREQPGNLIFWLNRQPHPESKYVSVVRKGGGLFGMGDIIVPEWSQDMNNVMPLRGKATSLPVGADHSLTPADGALLMEILRRIHTS
ncbi:MAG: alpha/beta hydrolase [Chromatiales bacterium]|nr:alpha/beta hydrolase [Chromatiales bacterium]